VAFAKEQNAGLCGFSQPALAIFCCSKGILSSYWVSSQRPFRRSQEDLTAVTAGLTLPWSNGAVEGHGNRLKLLKRQGYGRAGVGLLRQRVMQAV